MSRNTLQPIAFSITKSGTSKEVLNVLGKHEACINAVLNILTVIVSKKYCCPVRSSIFGIRGRWSRPQKYAKQDLYPSPAEKKDRIFHDIRTKTVMSFIAAATKQLTQ